jgi:Ca2+-binding RTX toxin-like protein
LTTLIDESIADILTGDENNLEEVGEDGADIFVENAATSITSRTTRQIMIAISGLMVSNECKKRVARKR